MELSFHSCQACPRKPQKDIRGKNLALVFQPRFEEMPRDQRSKTSKAQALSPGSCDLPHGSVLPHSGVEVIVGI